MIFTETELDGAFVIDVDRKPDNRGFCARAFCQHEFAEHGLEPHIRYGHEVVSADWSSADQLWTLTARNTGTGERTVPEARFLAMAQGYYHHHTGHTPDWPGLSSYKGRIVHAQAWPDDLDTTGQSIIIIGSGATAATMVPAVSIMSSMSTQVRPSTSPTTSLASTWFLAPFPRRLCTIARSACTWLA